jgi:hypothetical protein
VPTWLSTIPPSSGGTGVNNGSNTITVAGNVTYSGAFTQTFTATANTSLTLPTSGTLISTLTNMAANPVTGTPSSSTYLRGDGTWATAVASVASGTGISVSGSTGAVTITNGGVTSLAGTSNQISVSASTGSVTLSTPQSIATSSSVQFGSFGVGTAASGTTGEIRATNNVTAYYSDGRLKDRIGTIENALSKVKQLTGFLYKNNDVAKSFGYTSDEIQVGLDAQEVEKVQPEVVAPAPFDIGQNEDGTEFSKSGENYLTVRYERLIPLLVEAIKDLSNELDEIKAKL